MPAGRAPTSTPEPTLVQKSPGGPPVASFETVSFAYGSRRVLDSLTFSVPPGITALLGPNGAGKTTVLRLLATVRRPDSGSVVVLGSSTAEHDLDSVRSALGYLPQDAQWPGRLTVAQFMQLMCWLRKVDQAPTRIDRALTLVGLADFGRRQLGELSGGEHRKVMIAQALLHEPSLLILDEPTAGLDPRQRVAVRETLKGMRPATSTIISTHML